MNKYFQFSGTINGTNYFLRNLLSTLFAFIGGYLIGFGLGSEQGALFITGLIVMVPTLWFNICTIFKRCTALFPDSALWLTIGMVVFQVLGEVNPIFSIFPFVLGLILLFKNSNITEHAG